MCDKTERVAVSKGKSTGTLIDTWVAHGLIKELWSIKGKLQVKIVGTVDNNDDHKANRQNNKSS